MDYCAKRRVLFESDDSVYLLKTTQMNGLHAELFTFDFYHSNVEPLNSADLVPFLDAGYQARTDRYEKPDFRLRCSDFECLVDLVTEYVERNQWKLYVTSYDLPFPDALKTKLLTDLGFTEASDNELTKTIPKADFDVELQNLRTAFSDILKLEADVAG